MSRLQSGKAAEATDVHATCKYEDGQAFGVFPKGEHCAVIVIQDNQNSVAAAQDSPLFLLGE
jgi:hypothetical protein